MALFSTCDLKEGLDHLEFFLDDMDRKWLERGGGEGLKTALFDKAITCKEGKVQGLILYLKEQPIGIAWVEKTTPYYGNVVIHSIDAVYDEPLIRTSVEHGFFNDALLEIVSVDFTDQARACFCSLGLIENKRQRMSYWLEDTDPFPPMFSDVEFRELTESDKHFTSTLSFSAHQISRDYDMYPEMTIFDLRKKLEDRLFSQGYGPMVTKGSLMASVQGMDLGYIVLVEVPCWGFEKMPWIFDVCIKPEFQGKGLGRALIQESINHCISLGYPVMGLAVTDSNPALHLYDKMKFQRVDTFYEYVLPCTKNLYPRLTFS